MNLIFLRHGQALDNVKELISDKEIYWSILTDNGIKEVKESIENLPNNIDKMYVSPFPRTIQTANLVYQKYPFISISIDNRIREVNHGKYTHQKNNEELDNTRIKQINGDFLARLGEYGENRYDIELRLNNFLCDVYEKNDKNSTVIIVSHGSITSYMKRILNIKTPHLKTGKLETFNNVDFTPLFNHKKILENVKNN